MKIVLRIYKMHLEISNPYIIFLEVQHKNNQILSLTDFA